MMMMMSWGMSGGHLWDVLGMSGWCLGDVSQHNCLTFHGSQWWWRQWWWWTVTWWYGGIALIGMVMTWPRTIGEVQMSWQRGDILHWEGGRPCTGGDHWPYWGLSRISGFPKFPWDATVLAAKYAYNTTKGIVTRGHNRCVTHFSSFLSLYSSSPAPCNHCHTEVFVQFNQTQQNEPLWWWWLETGEHDDNAGHWSKLHVRWQWEPAWLRWWLMMISFTEMHGCSLLGHEYLRSPISKYI